MIKTMPCIICKTELKSVFGENEPDYMVFQPLDGIVIWTIGNYGSTFWDSLTNNKQLVFCVCDKCLVNNIDCLKFVKKEVVQDKWLEYTHKTID